MKIWILNVVWLIKIDDLITSNELKVAYQNMNDYEVKHLAKEMEEFI